MNINLFTRRRPLIRTRAVEPDEWSSERRERRDMLRLYGGNVVEAASALRFEALRAKLIAEGKLLPDTERVEGGER